jgi:transcriptional regulator with XRE-family HTH domain
MEATVTEVKPDLQDVLVRARTNPVRWGKPKGLTQQELAKRTGVSAVWIRAIEAGRRPATPATLGNICFALGIEPRWLRDNGYSEVADVVADCESAAILLAENPDTAEDHLRVTPGLSEDQKEQLVVAFHEIRKRSEPLGNDIWRRRRVGA